MYTEDEERGFSFLSTGKSEDKSSHSYMPFKNILQHENNRKGEEKIHSKKIIYQTRPKQT